MLWAQSGTAFWHSGVPFSVQSAPYSVNGEGIIQGGGPQFASVRPGVPLYHKSPINGVTQPGTLQWLNPDAFVSAVDPSTGACNGGDTPENCQFGNLGRNTLRGSNFTWSDLYLTKKSSLRERMALRLEGQFFNFLRACGRCATPCTQAVGLAWVRASRWGEGDMGKRGKCWDKPTVAIISGSNVNGGW